MFSASLDYDTIRWPYSSKKTPLFLTPSPSHATDRAVLLTIVSIIFGATLLYLLIKMSSKKLKNGAVG